MHRASSVNPIYHPSYRPDIDGLRAVAILPVILFHLYPACAPGGFVGVDVFFVISGYLISLIIFRSLERGTFSFSEFYAKRVRRIFPALIVVLSACYTLGWLLLLPDEFRLLGKHLAAGAGFVQNIILQREAGYFDVDSEMKPLLHLWSLAIEEQFYMAFPLMVWLLWRRPPNLILGLILTLMASFVLAEQGVRSDPVKAFYLPHHRFWEMISGALLALSQSSRLSPVFNRASPLEEFKSCQALTTLRSCASLLGFLLIAACVAGYHAKVPWPGALALVPVLGAVLLIAAGPAGWVNRNLLAARPMVWIGLISYPLYLWHWPLLVFLRIIEDGAVPSIASRLVVLMATFALAVLTYWLIEKPLRFGTRPKMVVLGLSASLAVILTIGVLAKNNLPEKRSLLIVRKGYAELVARFGSDRWYSGKEKWLFLGNKHDNTLRKLELRVTPSARQLQTFKAQISNLARAGEKCGVPVALMVGPDKDRIYSEYLPDELQPSLRRYVDFFLEGLVDVPNLVVYDPLKDLNERKSNGLLYWKTDSHWNQLGSLVAWQGLTKKIGLPELNVELRPSSVAYSGDLLELSGLKDVIPNTVDNYEAIWPIAPELRVLPSTVKAQKAPFRCEVVHNSRAVTDKRVWIIGDSFADGLRPYINGTFKEISYVGHWRDWLPDEKLPKLLERSNEKPDLIIVVRVERSF